MPHTHTIGNVRYTFPTLARLLAKATPARSGDELAGIAATSAQERIAAQLVLADLPLKGFLPQPRRPPRPRRGPPPHLRPARRPGLRPHRPPHRRRAPRFPALRRRH